MGAKTEAVTGGIHNSISLYLNNILVPDGFSDFAFNQVISLDRQYENQFTFKNLSSDNQRIKIVTDPEYLRSSDMGWDINNNPTLNVDYRTGEITFCLSPFDPNATALTIDDKGLQPIDGIYSGTITPPNLDLPLVFNIQWYRSFEDMAGNGRVFHVNMDNIKLNENGSIWYVDINNLQSWISPPSQEAITTQGSFELTISAVGVDPAYERYVV